MCVEILRTIPSSGAHDYNNTMMLIVQVLSLFYGLRHWHSDVENGLEDTEGEGEPGT